MGAELLLVLIAAVLTLQLFVSLRWLRGLVGAVLALQAIYWGLSYVGRGVILLTIEPSPTDGDFVADPRLATLGYEEALVTVLPVILTALAVYLLFFLVTPPPQRSFGKRSDFQGLSNLRTNQMLVLWFFGWAARLCWLGGVRGSVGDALLGMAPVAVAGYVLFAPALRGPRALAMAAVIAGELCWSYSYASKAPVVAVLVVLFLRISMRSWSVRTVRTMALATIATVPLFIGLQTIKLSTQDALVMSRTSDRYPELIEPLVVILYRFDLLSSATDASNRGPGNWIGPHEFLERLLTSPIPNPVLGYEKTLSGVTWYREMSQGGVSNPHAAVSLADGFAAEGYVLGGYLGVLLGALALFLALRTTSVLLAGDRLFGQLFALYLLASPAFFERGMLGLAETVGKGVQVALAGWFIISVITVAPARPARSSRCAAD